MTESLEIPVIGVFYGETDRQFEQWIESVERQLCDEVIPVPVIVISHNKDRMDAIEGLANRCVHDGRIKAEHLQTLRINLGPTAAFNLAALPFVRDHEKWPWIASLDPDATFAEGALRELYAVAQQGNRVGMISPIVLVPLDDDPDHQVCHCGHFPFWPRRTHARLSIFWESHFRKWSLQETVEFLRSSPNCGPFAACFSAALWSSDMFREIGFPDVRQFRTLNCGEIGYRAQLSNWFGRFAPSAIAFHPRGCTNDFSDRIAIEQLGSKQWHFYHAQALIAAKYFPDKLRHQASATDPHVQWIDFFPDLIGIEPEFGNKIREALFDKWPKFRFDHDIDDSG